MSKTQNKEYFELDDKEKIDLVRDAVENADYSQGTQELKEEIRKIIYSLQAINSDMRTSIVKKRRSYTVEKLMSLFARHADDIRKEERVKVAELCMKSQIENELKFGDGTGKQPIDYKWVVQTYLKQQESLVEEVKDAK